MTDDEMRDIWRQVSALTVRNEDIVRRIEKIETTFSECQKEIAKSIDGNQAMIMRLMWVIIVSLAGQILARFFGITTIVDIVKGMN